MTDEQRQKREQDEKHRAALILLFLALMADTNDHLAQTVISYLTGASSIISTSRTFTDVLYGAHTQASYYGRRLAGVNVPINTADAQFARTVMGEQAPYITRLMTQLANGDLKLADDGVSLTDGLANRIALYAKRVRGTGEEAWRLALPPETLINWALGFAEEHCPDCPVLAREGPYRADALPTTPGAGDTQCLSACQCFLITTDNQACFPSMQGVLWGQSP